MRKAILICCVLIFAVSLASAYAGHYRHKDVIDEEDFDYKDSPANKLGRGLINTATCWTEIPGEMARISNETDPLVGSTIGLFQGTFLALVRGLTGLYDTLTFAVPPYDEPVMEPEYGILRADEELKDYLW